MPRSWPSPLGGGLLEGEAQLEAGAAATAGGPRAGSLGGLRVGRAAGVPSRQQELHPGVPRRGGQG